MNINQLNRIQTVNLDAELNKAVEGSGTFKEILEGVMNNIIRPIVHNDGEVYGLSYDAGYATRVEDNIAEAVFIKRYSGKPVMEWFMKALEIKASGKVIDEIIQTSDCTNVIYADGTKETIGDDESPDYEDDTDYYDEYEEDDYEDEPDDDDEYTDGFEYELHSANYNSRTGLPNKIWIPTHLLKGTDVKSILREKFGRYMKKTGPHELPYEVDTTSEPHYVILTNIKWGRKIR